VLQFYKAASRRLRHVEFPSSGASQKGVPLSDGEAQNRAARVLAVADLDLPVDQTHLNALIAAVAFAGFFSIAD